MRSHLGVFSQAVAQSVQPFGDFLSRMTGQVFRTAIDFDARNDTRIGKGIRERIAIFHPLANGFVVEDRATNRLTETWSRHDQFAVRAPHFLRLRNS